jgi:hypothetical protein
MAVAGSFRSSFDDDHHHTVDAASEISSSGEEDAAGDEDEDVLPVARPREIVPTTVDLVHPEVVMDLSSIAQRMIAANHQLECCQVYVNSRKAVLEDSLYGLGVEKLSIEEVQKMPWDILVDTIQKWIQAMKVGALVLFASEKLLCEQVSLIISHTNSLSLLASTRPNANNYVSADSLSETPNFATQSLL